MDEIFFHIGLNARRNNVEYWGEFGYAKLLCKALERQGHQARIFCRDEHPQLAGTNDVILWICGPHVSEPIIGCTNFLWIISPPNMTSIARLIRFQAVFIASKELADLYRLNGVNAHYVAQATDPDFFHPGRDTGGARFDVTFVGNLATRAGRPIVHQAIDMGFNVKVWGGGWKKVVPPENYGGPRLDADDLACVYARSNVVLNCHMAAMSRMGMMSNRSYDALASGAQVISNTLRGFEAPDLPDLVQVADPASLKTALLRALQTEGKTGGKTGEAPPSQRLARAATVRRNYSFDARADLFIAQARQALARQARSHAAIVAANKRTKAKGQGVVSNMTLRDLGPEPVGQLARILDQKMAQGPLNLCVQLTDPAAAGQGEGHQAMAQTAQAVLRLGVIHARRKYLGQITIAPSRKGKAHPFHPGMFDLRQAQAIISGDAQSAQMDRLCARARRLLEALEDVSHPLALHRGKRKDERVLVRVMADRSLYPHSPINYDRNVQKQHVELWSRKKPMMFKRPVGVFLHLYYPELSGLFHAHLKRLSTPHKLYISTDTKAKANTIATTFPQADIRVFPNRGRDVFPKLYGFADAFAHHDITLHLHGKKSNHSNQLGNWLQVILDCLLPQPAELNRLLSFFQDIPDLGLVMPLTPQPIIGAAHWGENLELAQEVMARMGREIPPAERDLPDAFPVGGMFWARSSALQPLLDLRLSARHFPPEKNQLDATVAHAIERLYGVVCRQTGHKTLRVAASDNHSYRKFRKEFCTNKDLREAMATGQLC